MKMLVIYSVVVTVALILLLVHGIRLQDRVIELTAALERAGVPLTDWETADVPVVNPYAWQGTVIVNGREMRYPEKPEDGPETYYYGPKDSGSSP